MLFLQVLKDGCCFLGKFCLFFCLGLGLGDGFCCYIHLGLWGNLGFRCFPVVCLFLGLEGCHAHLQTLGIHMVEDHLRGFVDIGHHTENETGLFLQGVHPGIDILGIVVEDAFVKAHRITYHGSGQLCNKFFLGILRVSEVTFHISSKSFLYTC